MSTTTVAQFPTPHDAPAPARKERSYPGLHALPVYWLVLAGGAAGMFIDALLAVTLFQSLVGGSATVGTAVALAFGLVAAVAALETGVSLAGGHAATAWLGGLFVIGLGIALGSMRWLEGFTPATSLQTDQEVSGDPTQLAMAILLVAMYAVSGISLIIASSRIFVPARRSLRRHLKDRARLHGQIVAAEADYLRACERIANRPARLRRHEEQRDLALAQADAREAQLKDFARDEIVRALGPGAAPLVRAPHEPQPSKEDPEA